MKHLLLRKMLPLLAAGAITALLTLGNSDFPASAEDSEFPTVTIETEAEETSPALPNNGGKDEPDFSD